MVNKKSVMVTALILFFGLFTAVFAQGKFSITLDAGYAGAFSLADGTYGVKNLEVIDPWDRVWATFNSEGTISPSGSGTVLFGGSVDFSFSEAIGISLGFHTFKQNVDLVNDYYLSWTWGAFLGGDSLDIDDVDFGGGPPWDSTGDISVMPLTLDIFFRKDFSPTFSAGGAVGGALFLTKVNVDAFVGRQGGLVSWPMYYVDFYKVQITTDDASATLFGGHVQGFMEIKFSPRFAFVVAANYYLAGKTDIQYQVVNQSRWDGLFGSLYRLTAPQIGEQTLELNVSFFSVNAGVRVYLN